ncbi:MAG: TolC family protein [Flavobacteriales bacterium]|nr:TolC family protein [Flavobacteriales bacterium]MCB9449221.1 TolC family protein [Flavobacteriales bacterium]
MLKCLLAVMLFTALSSHAQTTWTLQQCIDQALKNNLQLRQGELNAGLSENNLLQSKISLLPTLNGNASQSYNFGRTVDPFTNSFITDRVRSNSFSLSSSVTLFSGFQNINNVQKAKYTHLADQADLEKNRNDIVLAVVNGYLQVLFAQELLSTASDQVSYSEKQLERTRNLVGAGALAKGNELDMEAQLALDQLAEVNARNQLDMAYLNLAQWLELPSTDGFSIEKPQLDVDNVAPILENPTVLSEKAAQTLPEIAAAEYRTKGAEKSLAMARGAQSPTLSVSASYGSGYSDARQQLKDITLTGVDTIGYTSGGQEVLVPSYSSTYEITPFSDQIDQNFSKAIGFYLSIPILNGWRTRTAVGNAKITLEKAHINEEQARNQLRKDVQQAVADATAAYNKFRASQKSTDALQEAFRYTDLKAEQGLVDAVTYIETKNRLAKSRSDLLQAKYDYFFKLKIVDYYAGKPLTF